MFQRNVLAPSSRYLSSYSSTLMIKKTGPSEALVPINATTGCHSPGNSDFDYCMVAKFEGSWMEG
jgi:hypothetical protein